MNLQDITIEDIYKDVEIVKECIRNGKWCSEYATPREYPDMLISGMFIDNHPDYAYYYGLDDVYINVKLYYDKLNDSTCFPNGYKYTTARLVRLSDIVMYKRYYKLKQLI